MISRISITAILLFFALRSSAPPTWHVPYIYKLPDLVHFWTTPINRSSESYQRHFRSSSRYNEPAHIVDTIVMYIQKHGVAYVTDRFVDDKKKKRPNLRSIYIKMQASNASLLKVLPTKYSARLAKELWTKGDTSIGFDKPLKSWRERTGEYAWSRIPVGYKHLQRFVEKLDEFGYDTFIERYCSGKDLCNLRAAYRSDEYYEKQKKKPWNKRPRTSEAPEKPRKRRLTPWDDDDADDLESKDIGSEDDGEYILQSSVKEAGVEGGSSNVVNESQEVDGDQVEDDNASIIQPKPDIEDSNSLSEDEFQAMLSTFLLDEEDFRGFAGPFDFQNPKSQFSDGSQQLLDQNNNQFVPSSEDTISEPILWEQYFT